MGPLLEDFKTCVTAFRVKGHNLLDYHNNRFDRDFVDFNTRQVQRETQYAHESSALAAGNRDSDPSVHDFAPPHTIRFLARLRKLMLWWWIVGWQHRACLVEHEAEQMPTDITLMIFEACICNYIILLESVYLGAHSPVRIMKPRN